MLVEEIGVPAENHQPSTSHWQTFKTKPIIYTVTTRQWWMEKLDNYTKNWLWYNPPNQTIIRCLKTITLEEVIRCEPPPSNSIPNPYPNTITKCGCTLYVYSLSNNVTVFFSMICTLIWNLPWWSLYICCCHRRSAGHMSCHMACQ